jgi:transcription initiation factor TFIIF subunit alpha
MAPKSAESLLFHKKKTIKKEPSTPSTTSQGSQPSQLQQSQSQQSLRKSVTPRVQAIPPAGDADDSSKLPDGEFSEFKLMSSALNGWKYDVMKFDSRKTIDISTWEEPIKLNRKELRREEPGSSSQVPAGHMLGPDGKPVIGADGNIVMVDADGRPIAKDGGEVQSKDKDKGKAGGRKKFQKKTRQVFLVPEAIRQLRREERYPWVMEDAKQNEMWVGKLEEVARAETHALFMPAAQEFFKFVPANRWYKFQKKPKHRVLGLEEAEAVMARIQKNKDPERWLLHRKKEKKLSSETSEMFKAEAENRVVPGSSSLVYSSGQSRAVGGRALRTTNRGAHGGGGDDDDDEGGPRRKKEENDMEGDLDEQLFDDEFADDDEAGPADMDEEEAKELEERLKREYKSANKTREGYVDESESEDGESQLTKDGKSLKKLMRKLEKNAAYDSDEERNPYASSNDEEEEEEPIPPQEPPQEAKSRSASQQPTPKPSQPPTSTTQNGSAVGSRATSPAPASMGGHSVVAKRATSPKAPKLKTSSTNNGRVTSGQSTGSRATSPVTGSRATSPSPLAKGPGSPTPNGQPASNKRKATDDLGGNAASAGAAVNGAPKPKKRKPLPTGPPPDGELEEKMLVKWLQNTPNATTRDCIQHFTPYLTTDAKKAKFTAMVKEVAQLRGGILILRNSEASAAASPTS